MSRNTGKKAQQNQNEFQTPLKPKLKLSDEPQTAAQTFDKMHQNSIQHSNTTLNIFKKKRHPKRIKKSTLHLLQMQRQILQSYKKSLTESYSDSVNQTYKQELDKIFVIVARITHIKNDKKYFIFHCQDQGNKDFEFYFNKHPTKEYQTKLFGNSQKMMESRYITNVDELQFELIPGQGIPYFKFFIILREIPIFDKSEQEVLSNEQKIDEQSNKGFEDSARKRFLSHIKETQFRVYIQHFEKIKDFNYLIWHNMHVCFEEVCEHFSTTEKQKEIEI